MITKTITPIICNNTIAGTLVIYRVLGLCVYKKKLLSPEYFGFKEDYSFNHSI